MGSEATQLTPAARPRPGRHRLGLTGILLTLASCSDSPAGPPVVTRLEISAGNGQQAVAGSAVPVQPAVTVLDESGRAIEGVPVSFSVVAGDGWTTTTSVTSNTAGVATTWWMLGPDPARPQRLRVRTGTVTTDFTATATPPVPGTTLLGRNVYMEYLPGDLPVVITAPHGGTLTPGEIPDRTFGTTVRDRNTQEMTRAIRQAFQDLTGRLPHVVITRLHRIKLDANREIVEAAQGNVHAERAWYEWHAFIETAKVAAASAGPQGQAMVFDLHGHGHPIARVEVGYLLSRSDLALDDAALGSPALMAKSSIRTLAANDGTRFVELIRGDTGLGELLERAGYPAVPSARQPDPGVDPYFSGGYNTVRHGSRDGGNVSAIQLELDYTGVRDTDENRERFADAFAELIEYYFETHLGAGLAALSVH